MDFGAYLEQEKARSVGHRRPVSIAPDATLGAAVERMQEKAVGCLLVVDEEGALVGILTERDLLRKVFAAGASASLDDQVAKVMTPDPVVLRSDDSLAGLLRRMYEGGFRHLPLLDSDGRLLGTVSNKRVIGFLADHFAETVYNLPPEPDNFGATREGG
jgi:CBS domain-containing protein